jgi:2'-5' RNA ligase
MALLRTFIAIEVTAEIRAKATRLIAQLDVPDARIKWVEPENLHLTMVFLGDVEMNELPQVCKLTEAAVADFSPIDVSVRGAGAFPDAHRPRTLWLAVNEGAEPLVLLHQSLEQQLAQMGYRPEHRRFRPHLTLGRVRQGSAALALRLKEQAQYEAGRMEVDEVTIFSSTLGRSGPKYEPLGHAELKGL